MLASADWVGLLGSLRRHIVHEQEGDDVLISSRHASIQLLYEDTPRMVIHLDYLCTAISCTFFDYTIRITGHERLDAFLTPMK